MRHCCQFTPDDVYYLRDNDLYSSRNLAIGFCPICGKPTAELTEWRFDGIFNKISVSGIKANDLVLKHKDEIVYSKRECNYSKFKSKPFGWVYGLNKSMKINKREIVKQFACDFYGNKELIKIDRKQKRLDCHTPSGFAMTESQITTEGKYFQAGKLDYRLNAFTPEAIQLS